MRTKREENMSYEDYDEDDLLELAKNGDSVALELLWEINPELAEKIEEEYF